MSVAAAVLPAVAPAPAAAAPEMLTTDEVAAALGYRARAAIHQRVARGDLRLSACRLPGRHRRCWSRSRLVAAGFLSPPPAPVIAAPPAPPALLPSVVVATWRIA